MGIFDNLFSRFSKTEAPQTQTKSNNNPMDDRWYPESSKYSHEAASEYTAYAWAAVAIDNIIRDTCNQPWVIVDNAGKPIDNRRVPDDILMPLINGYNGISLREMLEKVVINMKICGNGYLIRTTSTAYGQRYGIIDSFLPIEESKVKIQTNRTCTQLLGYNVSFGDGTQVTFSPDEVIHFRNPIGGKNIFAGIGEIEKVRLEVTGHRQRIAMANNLAHHDGVAPFILAYDGDKLPIQPDELKKHRDTLKQSYHSGFKPVIVPFPNSQVTTLPMSFVDMQFIDQEKFSRETILAIFGVPPEVAGVLEKSNRATASTSWTGYYKSTCNPLIAILEDVINTQHIRRINQNMSLKFQRHATGDVDTVVKMVTNGIITPNDAAEQLGQDYDETDESRNMFYIPANLIPIGMANEQLDTTGQTGQSSIDDTQKKNLNSEDQKTLDEFVKAVQPNRRFQAKYLRSFLLSRGKIETKFTDKLAEFFQEQGKRVSAAAAREFSGKSIKAASILFSLDDEDQKLEEALTPLHTSGVQRGVRDVNSVGGSGVNPEISNPAVKRAIFKLGQRITGINDTSKAAVEKLIKQATDESWNLDKIQSELQSKFDQFAGYRARMIARTEAAMSWQEGAYLSYKDLDVQTVDIVGCSMADWPCGANDVKLNELPGLDFHPNHLGCPVPSYEP